MILEGTPKSRILLLPVVIALAGCVPGAYVFEPPPLPAYVYPDGYYTTAPPLPYGYPGQYGYPGYYGVSGHPGTVVYVDHDHRRGHVNHRRGIDGRDERRLPGTERGRDPRDRDRDDREQNGGTRDRDRSPDARPPVLPVRPPPRTRDPMPNEAGGDRAARGADAPQAVGRNGGKARSGSQRQAE